MHPALVSRSSRFRLAACLAPAAAFFLAVPACKPPGQPAGTTARAPDAGALRVGVSILPQVDFVRRIGGDRVQVHAFVAAGQDPHSFSATPDQVIALGGSDAFFTIGVPFEAGLIPKIKGTLPHLRIVAMAEGIPLEPAEETAHDHHREGAAHSHEASAKPAGPDGGEKPAADGHDEHDHDHGPDLHLWLSPPAIKIMARTIRDTLADLDPANAAFYTANLEKFHAELDLLHTELSFLLEPVRGKSFYVYHAAFGHFAEAYGLEQKSIEAGGKSPSPKQLMDLIDDAKRTGAKVIFVQPQFDPESAKVVAAAIGGRVASIDPLAEDVLGNLRIIARAIYDGLTSP